MSVTVFSWQDHYYVGCYSLVEILPVAGSIIFKRVPPLRHLPRHSRHYFFRILQSGQVVGITGVTFLLIYKSNRAQIHAFSTFPNAHGVYRITVKSMIQSHRPINSPILFIAS